MALQGFNETYYLNAKLSALQATETEWVGKDATFLQDVLMNVYGLTPEDHYTQYGYNEGLAPNAYFNAEEYTLAKATDMFNKGGYMSIEDAQADFQAKWPADAYQHYLQYGFAEGINPSNAFDESSYLDTKLAALQADATTAEAWAGKTAADVKAAFVAAGLTSVGHFELYGQNETGMAVTAVPEGESVEPAKGGTTAGGSYTLTNGTDIATANVFESGLVYTPGGDDRINSLQDEDRLTGTGDNPTLNVDLGNSNDSGATTVTPELNGIETLNVKFTGSGAGAAVNQLDLQDATGLTKAINVNRINDGIATATLDNISALPENLSISNSGQTGQNVTFAFADGAVNGAADEANLTISNVNIGNLIMEERGVADQGIETLNLKSSGSANVLGVLQAEDLQTLTITGDQNLTLGALTAVMNGALQESTTYTASLVNVAGSLTSIDASGLAADMSIVLGGELNAGKDNTSGVSVEMAVTTGSGDDTFILSQGANIDAAVNNTDTIDGGATVAATDTTAAVEGGANKLVLLGGAAQNVAAAAAGANIKNVQALEIRAGHDAALAADTVTVDADAFDALAGIYVRNEGQQVVGGNNVVGAEIMTANLNDLTAAQAAAITVAHGTTGNNGIANNIVNVNLKAATGTTDLVSVVIQDDANTDPRFNLQLRADGDNAAGTQNAAGVESVTITDNDTESNTINLLAFAEHTGTITLAGGETSDFLNLDATANLNRYDQTGAVAGDGRGVVDVAAGAAERLVATTVDASTYLGDVVVRVSDTAAATGAQTITMGVGNDTVIFDDLNDNTAGLTISDTVEAGENADDTDTDTLAIDGDGVNINISASEWTNVKNFESVRLVGNGQAANNALNAVNAYNLTLTDDFITNNGVAVTGTTNRLINIVNDNDPANGVTTAVTAGVGAVSGVTIDARQLSANRNFNYDGEEGAARTADRFIMADANINGLAVIDGGAVFVDNSGNTSNVANADVMEIRNAAVVTIGDLSGISNVGTLQFTNDQAATQTSTLVLDNTTVDRLVNTTRAADATNVETLAVQARGNLVGAATVNTALNLDARQVNGNFALNINTSLDNAGGATNAGDDTVQMAVNLGGAAQTINLGADTATGVDTVTFTNAANNVVLTAAGLVDTVTFNDATATATQAFNLTGVEVLDFSASALTVATITTIAGTNATGIIGHATNATTINAAASAAAMTLTGGAGADTITGGAGADTITGGGGADTFTGGAGIDTYTDLGTGGVADTITDFNGAGADIIDLSGAGNAAGAAPVVLTAVVADGTAAAVAHADGNVLRLTTALAANYDTQAEIATLFGAGAEFAAAVAGDEYTLLIAAADTGNTTVWNIEESGANTSIADAADTVQLVGTLTGVNAAGLGALAAANFQA